MAVPPMQVEAPKVAEVLIQVASGTVFPLVVIKAEQSTKPDSTIRLKVGRRAYEKIQELYGTDELCLFFDPINGQIEAWSFDMLLCFKLMEKIGAMSSMVTWIDKSRDYLNAFLESKREPSVKSSNPKVLARLKKILEEIGLLSSVDSKKELYGVAKDMFNSGLKDSDTTIYRLAMSIFHVRTYSGKELFPEFDEPLKMYLTLSQNSQVLKDQSWFLEHLQKYPVQARARVTKTFMCFIIAAYVAYSTQDGGK